MGKPTAKILHTLSGTAQKALIVGARNAEPVQGFTHGFYKYPARFSPNFVRAAMRQVGLARMGLGMCFSTSARTSASVPSRMTPGMISGRGRARDQSERRARLGISGIITRGAASRGPYADGTCTRSLLARAVGVGGEPSKC